MTALTPLAYSREAERCAKLARLAWADMDYRLADRMRRLADEYRARASVH